MFHPEVDPLAEARAEIAALQEQLRQVAALRDAELASLNEAYHKLRKSWPNRVWNWLLGTTVAARYPQEGLPRENGL